MITHPRDGAPPIPSRGGEDASPGCLRSPPGEGNDDSNATPIDPIGPAGRSVRAGSPGRELPPGLGHRQPGAPRQGGLRRHGARRAAAAGGEFRAPQPGPGLRDPGGRAAGGAELRRRGDPRAPAAGDRAGDLPPGRDPPGPRPRCRRHGRGAGGGGSGGAAGPGRGAGSPGPSGHAGTAGPPGRAGNRRPGRRARPGRTPGPDLARAVDEGGDLLPARCGGARRVVLGRARGEPGPAPWRTSLGRRLDSSGCARRRWSRGSAGRDRSAGREGRDR
jgi:hypothetical protein